MHGAGQTRTMKDALRDDVVNERQLTQPVVGSTSSGFIFAAKRQTCGTNNAFVQLHYLIDNAPFTIGAIVVLGNRGRPGFARSLIPLLLSHNGGEALIGLFAP